MFWVFCSVCVRVFFLSVYQLGQNVFTAANVTDGVTPDTRLDHASVTTFPLVLYPPPPQPTPLVKKTKVSRRQPKPSVRVETVGSLQGASAAG